MREIILTPADANRRLDKYLVQYLNTAPRSFIYKMLRKKRVKLNGKRAEGNEITAEGDIVRFYISDEALDGFMSERATPAYAAPIDIIYEDASMLVVNKPAGLLSQGGCMQGSNPKGIAVRERRVSATSPGINDDSLLTRALFYLKQSGAYDISRSATFSPALCNRLDRNTSGLMVCGKTLAALQRINADFAGRSVEKEYIAVAHGTLSGDGVLEGYLYKDKKTNTVKVNSDGQNGLRVKTEYETIAAGKHFTLLFCRPVTGRSHQIRAQMAAIGHPLAGDVKYSGKKTPYAPGQLLHCYRLKIGQATFTAPLPQGFINCLRDWFGYESDYIGRGLRDAHVPDDI